MVTGFFDKHFPFLFRYHYQPDTIFLFWPLSPMSCLKTAHGRHNLVLGKRFELEFFFIGPISSLTTEKCIIPLPVINHQKVLINGFTHYSPASVYPAHCLPCLACIQVVRSHQRRQRLSSEICLRRSRFPTKLFRFSMTDYAGLGRS